VDSEPHFLSLLAADDRCAVEAVSVRRRFARGSVIMRSGDDSASAYVLLEGRVKIAAPDDEGREAVLGFRGPGDVVGELAALDGRPRSSTVAALEPVVALAVPRVDFDRLVNQRPGVGKALIAVLAARLRAADSERADFGTHDVLGRVARRLIELAERYGEETGGGIAISLPLTQEDLAGWTGSSREAVSKALSTLRGLGCVETHRRGLVVADIETLRNYAR
jgi:CRP/FNR family cyclic AMP-dependent transcriptional regulator